MRDAAAVIDELILCGDRIRSAENKVKLMKRERDALIYEANEKYTVPIATIATALGVRRETIVSAKMRGQIEDMNRRHYEERTNTA